MPFRNEAFDAIFCCYLLELLSADDIVGTLREFRRVLRDRGNLTLVLIGQNTPMFNAIYKVLGKVAPAFWGRQVEQKRAYLYRCYPTRSQRRTLARTFGCARFVYNWGLRSQRCLPPARGTSLLEGYQRRLDPVQRAARLWLVE